MACSSAEATTSGGRGQAKTPGHQGRRTRPKEEVPGGDDSKELPVEAINLSLYIYIYTDIYRSHLKLRMCFGEISWTVLQCIALTKCLDSLTVSFPCILKKRTTQLEEVQSHSSRPIQALGL